MTPITLGIEEELMIVNPRSRDIIADPDPGIFDESRWLAQHFGTLAFLSQGDPTVLADVEEGVKKLIEEVREDARAFECESEVEHIGRIVREGSCADRQEDIDRLARLDGADEGQALRSVVDAIFEEAERGAGGMAQAQDA